MKTKSILLGLALAIAALNPMTAHAAVTIGSLDDGNCYPFNCNDSGSNVGQSMLYQEMYNSTVFPGSLSFNQISFRAQPGTPQPVILNGDYDITFGTTTASLNSPFPASLSNVATFFDGHLSSGPLSSTYTITGSAYAYDPSQGNLVMEILVTNQTNLANGDGNGFFWADYTGSAVTRGYYFSTDTGGTGFATGALVTTFGVGGVPEPATWALFILGFGGIGAAMRRQRSRGIVLA